MRTGGLGTNGRLGALAVTLAVLLGGFFLVISPQLRGWGASDAEIHAVMPGDELLEARTQSTRAITIDAPVDAVWPWLAQIGQDRAGFYSFELLEDLVGAQMENLSTLRPELQQWKVGDKLWMYPPDRLNGAGHGVLLRIEPGRALVFGTRRVAAAPTGPYDGIWAFELVSLREDRTRLLVRTRVGGRPSWSARTVDAMLVEPMHFVMERKMMEGIKRRAEGASSSEVGDVFEIVLFLTCFVLFVRGAVGVVRAPEWRRRVIGLLGAGLAFQLLTFVQPMWALGVIVVMLVSALCAPPPPSVGASVGA